jgi:hypothetical protein
MKKLIVLLISLFAMVAWAGSSTLGVRCDGKIIGVGDSQTKVLNYCGEPERVYTIGSTGRFVIHHGYRSSSGSYSNALREVWVLGAAKNADHVDYNLTFENGVLKRIEHVR